MFSFLSIWVRLALSVVLWIVLLPVMLLLLPFRTDRCRPRSVPRSERMRPGVAAIDPLPHPSAS
ncbi:hypothetical protein [Rathayibacter tanaceti]|uniref:Uncharacterized protein n=2 Tax=Rathayibacter tanaceti TaxID=1671680 RepID=A0A162GT69_9MICO|nr:hypothetical protein [Rathayibacter tanaceti]KZX22258.1 hypothetical protein ACH61_00587 [Rathayibacter tanaceti]QHC55868.1 hypothetical protein GSU10_09655 [Rathayibacter tanaceti]TCO39305.1 hypothetical protein EV639_101249 [Rathayibacter tanaceti]